MLKDINSMSTCGRRRSLNLLERLRVKNYKYDSKKKKFTRDRKSKVVQNTKKKTISVKITTNNVNFKRYRRYRFKVRSYVKYNGKQIFSKLSKQKIVTR